jgi:hypothetical protein
MLSSVGEHARLDHIITVKRHTPYYFWKFIIPLIFIVFMAWSVLWLDPTDYRPGIGVATASVFSLIAFLLGLRQMTPKVPYLTQMDELVLAVTSLVFLTLGEVVFISRLVQRERLETARRVDRYSRWTFLAALVVVLAWPTAGGPLSDQVLPSTTDLPRGVLVCHVLCHVRAPNALKWT